MVAKQKKQEGKMVWAIPYDYIGACEGASDVCLGVPYFNWGPGYLEFIQASIAGKWKSNWIWMGPDWKNINDPDTSTVGFKPGPALSSSAKKALDSFISDLGTKRSTCSKGLYTTRMEVYFSKDGEIATDKKIWYMEQLLKGMLGQSSAK